MAISSEPTTETDLQYFIADHMEAAGISPDNVIIHQPASLHGCEYLVRSVKYINGEQRKCEASIDVDTHHPDLDVHTLIKQESELIAKRMAEAFKEEITDNIRVSYTELEFCLADGASAECRKCNNRVTLPGSLQNTGQVTFSETPTPTPLPVDVENFVRKLDEEGEEVVKMYLFGALRRVCECEFGKTERFK